MIGNNTDWYGFAKSIEDIQGYDNVVIFGSGGVIPSLLYYFKSRNSCPVHIIARNPKKIEEFKGENIFTHDIEKFEINAENSFIINSIPSKANMDWRNLFKMVSGEFLYALDLNYHLKATEFLNYFNSSVDTKNGLDMLIYQALMSLDIWYDKSLSLSIDVGDLRRELIGKYYDE